MNLPLIFDITLGLIFIYLILSLLTSELQELIATLLQWRADHLKKSIEVLISGGTSDDPVVQQFADQLYDSPLIQALNQEAKGPIAKGFRRIATAISNFFRRLSGGRNVFGDRKTGPSYIPANAFASALLQKLEFEPLVQKVSELTLRRFNHEKLALVKEVVDALRNSIGDDSFLEGEFNILRRNLSDIIEDFVTGRMRLSTAIDRSSNQLIQFIENTEVALSENNLCQDVIRQRLPYLKQAIDLRKLEPAISEVLRMILDNEQNLPPAIAEMVSRIRGEMQSLPNQLQQNLMALSKRAQNRAEGLEEGAVRLRQEVEEWFDQSMQRATGVYRRNAKGVAIILGILVAVLVNVDTFHMVNRLSKDTALRSAISASADQAAVQFAPALGGNATAEPAEIQENLESIKTAVSNVLGEIPLPIGWDSENLQEQARSEVGWPIPYLRRSLGWIVSGLALSMGASFWFDLLSKIVRVRNTGRPPGDQT